MMKKLKGATSAVQVSSSSPRCFKTWTQLNWTGAGLTKPNWIGKQKAKLGLKKLRQTCILATLSIPTNLGSSWSTLQPSLVNLSTLVRFDHLWWDLVRFDEIWWDVVSLGEPGNPAWLLEGGKAVQEKWTPGHPVNPLYGHIWSINPLYGHMWSIPWELKPQKDCHGTKIVMNSGSQLSEL